MLGSTFHHFSRTQATVALSSAEAELYAITSGVAEALGFKSFLQETELFTTINLHAFTDSSSGKSIASRDGTSKKTKHIDIRLLWVQDVFKQQFCKNSKNKLFKVHTLQNPADILTKYSTPATIQRHLDKLGLQDTLHHSIQCVFTNDFM